jgi:hypothetical protein
MVHVGVGNEDMADLEKFPGGQGAQVSQIEEDGPPLELEFDIDHRITLRAIDQLGMEAGIHEKSIYHLGWLIQFQERLGVAQDTGREYNIRDTFSTGFYNLNNV